MTTVLLCAGVSFIALSTFALLLILRLALLDWLLPKAKE